MSSVILHGYWRSLATYRVRIALNVKEIEYTEKDVDLGKGEQRQPAHLAMNPQGALPVLEHAGLRITQSLAIMEYIDESWPQPPLLPSDAAGKARVRSLAQITIADVHPLIVPRVRDYLQKDFSIDEPRRNQWVRHWFDEGTRAIEERLGDGMAGRFSHGDQLTIADMALASHVAGAQLFKCDMSKATRLMAIHGRCQELEAFKRAHPLAQPGAATPP